MNKKRPEIKNKTGNSIIKEIRKLFLKQKRDWNRLKLSYEQLHTVLTKKINLSDSHVFVQYNPARATYSRAKVDPSSISRRKCFLCKENLSSEQKHIQWNDFLILLNPAPIFPMHCTVSYSSHISQQILHTFPYLLQLAESVSPEMSCLYNGPRCGASAPDHLHFQLIPRHSVPIEKDLDRIPGKKSPGYSFFTIDNRKIVVLKNKNRFHLVDDFSKLYFTISSIHNLANTEPMLNIVTYFMNNTWIVIVFLRKAHRPSCYYAKGKNSCLISPGAVDMAGTIICVRHNDFVCLNREMILKIYNEVSMSREDFNLVTENY